MYSAWLHNKGIKLPETTNVTENVKKERKHITMLKVPVRMKNNRTSSIRQFFKSDN
jgi:hypothetical protein